MKDTLIKSEYDQLKQSGLFWEFFPELSGEWEVDRTPFTEFYQKREEKVRPGETYQQYAGRLDAPPPPCSITEEVVRDLQARSAVGFTKYGVTLDRKDLSHRDWLQHAYEECLDQAKYLKRAIKDLDEKKDAPITQS